MTQTIDLRFELLFLFLSAISLVSLIAALLLFLRAKRPAAIRLLVALGIGWTAYLSLVFLVAAVTPQRVVPMNQDLCFDDLCFAVANVQTAAQLGPATQPARAKGLFYIVTVRASSHARGRSQGERGLRAMLWSHERTYEVSPKGQIAWEASHPQTVALSARLAPGQTISSDQVFDIPTSSTDLGLILTNGFTPGYFVIGECPLFHQPTILRLSRQ